MCNRYNISTNLKSIASELDAQRAFDFDIAAEIFPLTEAPTLVFNRMGERELRPMIFGLTPLGKVRDKRMPAYNNARVESHQKWPWKIPLQRFRCVVPMTSFREPCYWGESEGKEVNFRRADGRLLLAAAIYSVTTPSGGEPTLSMSLVMRPALPVVMDHGHHRSPFLLTLSGVDAWIDRSSRPTEQSLDVLRRHAAEPALETDVAREMAASWMKRKSAYIKKRDQQIAENKNDKSRDA